MLLVSAEEMREMDRQTIDSYGLPGRVLMEVAGRGAVRWLLECFPEVLEMKIAVLAGRGNNGGDGFVMARHLHHLGGRVTVFLLTEADRISGDAAANLALARASEVPVIGLPDEAAFAAHRSALAHQELFIDAILGTGLQSEVKGFFKTVIDYLNGSGKPVFAVDIPSGLNADTGHPCGVCVRADATATFGFAKTGLVLYPGADFAGDLSVVDIGIPPFIADRVAPDKRLLTENMVSGYVMPRPSDTHKGITGHLLAAAGSCGKTGAAKMTALSALRAGAGLVTLAVPAGVHAMTAAGLTEVMTLPAGKPDCQFFDQSCLDLIMTALEGKFCLALGPGIGTDPATADMVRELVRTAHCPQVIDADGLNCLAGHLDILKARSGRIVLTPHPGEMARLTGLTAREVQRDRITCARSLAEQFGVYVVLKGAGTVIAHPDGKIYINRTGNPGMAAGGMGDVLTGLIAGFICQGYDIGQAAHLGVYLHGAAADRLAEKRGPGYLASEVMAEIPEAMAALMKP
ncbi:MAG: NAD(P)H-hydrate dehydratase [Thermodesulfobacteriota bacterium]